MRIFFGFMLVLSVAGCKQNPELPALISPYKIDIQQGNVITQEMVGKLKAGMTRSQVRFVLGSPLVVDMFHSDRWDYIYLLQRQGKPDDRRRLTVIFDGDKLLRLEGDVVLTDTSTEPELPVTKPPATKPPAAATPKPAATKPVAATPAPDAKKTADKPPVTPTPVAKPEAATGAKPPATNSETAAGDATSPATADATKSDAKGAAAATDAKPDAASADEKKDAPKQRGPFGRMLEKIGL